MEIEREGDRRGRWNEKEDLISIFTIVLPFPSDSAKAPNKGGGGRGREGGEEIGIGG